MNKKEREELYILKYKKKIKNIELAELLGVSGAMISMFFNNKSQMSDDKIQKMQEYIKDK